MNRKMEEMMQAFKNLQSFREDASKLDDEVYEQLFGVPKGRGLANIDKQIYELNRKVALERAANFDRDMTLLNMIAIEQIAAVRGRGTIAEGADDELELLEISIAELNNALLEAYRAGQNR